MNEEEPERAESWREYFACLSEKWIRYTVSSAAMLIGMLGALGIVYYVVANPFSYHFILYETVCWFASIFLVGLVPAFLAWMGYDSLQRTRRIPPVAPPIRQNSVSLPAQDVLVRASSAPTEEAKKALLRATVADTETPAEELLRPR